MMKLIKKQLGPCIYCAIEIIGPPPVSMPEGDLCARHTIQKLPDRNSPLHMFIKKMDKILKAIFVGVCVGTWCKNDLGYYDWQLSDQERRNPTAEATDRKIQEDLSDSVSDAESDRYFRQNRDRAVNNLYRSMDEIRSAGEDE